MLFIVLVVSLVHYVYYSYLIAYFLIGCHFCCRAELLLLLVCRPGYVGACTCTRASRPCISACWGNVISRLLIAADGIRATEHHGTVLCGVAVRRGCGNRACSRVLAAATAAGQQTPVEGPPRVRA